MRYKNRKEEIEKIVSTSFSWAEVCRQLGRKERTGNQSHIKNVCVKLNIDYSHFTGQGWNKGKVFAKKDIELYLSNKIKINSHKLKNKLYDCGLKNKECEICSIKEWRGEEVVLELDHKDSNHLNNNLDNIQILCPNCHALETRKRIISKKAVKIDGRKLNLKRPRLRKVLNRPDYNQLKTDILILGYRGSGRKYNVSDNCIRKWLKWESVGMVDNSVLETDVK